jgi:pimeloyl-ACP methyl ester carboxylesterase
MTHFFWHNGRRLACDITAPSATERGIAGIFFLPGFRSDKNGGKATAIAAWAREKGYGMTRFDYSGHGESDGQFIDGTIGDWLSDALAIFDTQTTGKQILVGSSMGGWIALHIALMRPERVHGIVGIATAVDFTEELIWNILPESAKQKLQMDGAIYKPSDYSPSPTPFTLKLILDGRNHLLFPRKKWPINCPIRLIHGQMDTDVPWEFSSRILSHAASADVHLHLIPDGDHRLSRREDIDIIIDFVKSMITYMVFP